MREIQAASATLRNPNARSLCSLVYGELFFIVPARSRSPCEENARCIGFSGLLVRTEGSSEAETRLFTLALTLGSSDRLCSGIASTLPYIYPGEVVCDSSRSGLEALSHKGRDTKGEKGGLA